jgi:hypothetical protein
MLPIRKQKNGLMTYEQVSSADLGTHVYKAGGVLTGGSGAQIIYYAAEALKQQFPTAVPPPRRRASTANLKDTEAASAMSVKGHKKSYALMSLNSYFIYFNCLHLKPSHYTI